MDVCNFHMSLQFSYEFAIFISVCDEGEGKSPLCIFFAVVQFVLQLCHVFCSCAFCLADVLKLCIIPTYIFADVQMK